MAEFYHAQDKLENSAEQAAKLYQTSAEQGCQLGTHWIGVFYHIGHGVTKNIPKAIENLKISSKAGNSQSVYQLFILYSEEEGYKDPVLAYKYLEKACHQGVTFFEKFHEFFKEN